MIRQCTIRIGNQRGAIMITALMILLLMTVFGISTMDTNILEEKMAGNMRDRNTAFQSAESALRAAEAWLAAQANLPDIRDVTDSSDTSPLWDLNTADPDSDNNIPWWEEDARSV
ncbi:MAG: pilus assembly protein PilZ, partial [Gammaproteobacteria bacterium]|nr:pilus assembly protein PilZ [Gammaproteobacteria bacterium]